MMPHEVIQKLPERDLAMLMVYAQRYMLPQRRMQVQMALAAQVMASGTRPLADFDILYVLDASRKAMEHAERANAQAHDTANLFAGMTGKGIVVVGRKRRERAKRLRETLVKGHD
jgi:hypothetical protein